jgi:hypothetical protein
MVEKSLIHPSAARVFSPIIPRPFGPIIIPDKINPIIPGMRIRRKRIGDNKIIKSIKEKTNTGLVSGN